MFKSNEGTRKLDYYIEIIKSYKASYMTGRLKGPKTFNLESYCDLKASNTVPHLSLHVADSTEYTHYKLYSNNV